jgi:hypothetical protein
MLPGGGGEGIAALSRLGHEYPKARLALCGFGPAGKNLAKRLAEAGIDAAHINIVSQSRTTAEDAHHSAALLKPKPDESWLLITAAMHMPARSDAFGLPDFRFNLSARIYDPRPIRSIYPFRYRLLSVDPTRQGCEGVGRPHVLSVDGQNRRAFSGA